NSLYEKGFNFLKGIKVIFENEDIVILFKPVGVLSQQAKDNDISVNEWLVGYLINKGEITPKTLESFKPSVCNRLDRNTAGLVLCGKTMRGLQGLSKMLKERTLNKYYITLCEGIFDSVKDVKAFIVKDHKTNKSLVVNKTGDKDASPIHTVFYPIASSNNSTLLKIHLLTGKSHQIRAQLSNLSHPIVGDVKYGAHKLKSNAGDKSHQLLVAYMAGFPKRCPEFPEMSGKIIVCDLPEEFKKILKETGFEKWEHGLQEV
ncbi:MAG: RluA family pseudouridine synthase, partial [Lachnospiraceae bacterium]|nr:RluA family pseudouridine synthase [Lachnospiraceae bacterium]